MAASMKHQIVFLFLLLLPRPCARAAERGGGGHPLAAADAAVGALRLRRDALPQLQPHRALPVRLQPAEIRGRGAHPNFFPLHPPRAPALHDHQAEVGSLQPRGQNGKRGAGGAD